MPVEIWYGRHFEYSHEREALASFWDQLAKIGNVDNELRLIIVEPSINTASIDMLLISSHAIVIAELKSLSTSSLITDYGHVSIAGRENGPWTYSLTSGVTRVIGGAHNSKNPLSQVKIQRSKVADWLQDHSARLSPALATDPSKHVAGWVVISPGFNSNTSRLDLPWGKIDPWFKVLTINQLAATFARHIDPELSLSSNQLRWMLKELGLRQCHDIAELIPEAPLAARVFSPPPPAVNIKGRDQQKRQLIANIRDKSVAVISLGGLGGVGKTALAAWAVDQLADSHVTYWIDCANKKDNLTAQSLLSAISTEAPLSLQMELRGGRSPATAISTGEYTFTDDDRYETALDLLSRHPSLLVFDDYHTIARQRGIAAFVARAFRFRGYLHVLLTTRENPFQPDWSREAYTAIDLDKLPLDAFSEYVTQQLTQGTQPTSQQLTTYYRQVAGSPGLARSYYAVFDRHRRANTLDQLPTSADLNTDMWLKSLFGTLSDEAKGFAQTLSILGVGEKLGMPLICGIYRSGSAERAVKLVDELVDKYVMNKSGEPDTYVLDELAANYLATHADNKRRNEAHRLIGEQLLNFATKASDPMESAYLQARAIDHLSIAGPRDKILQVAHQTHQALFKAGDRDRALTVLRKALEAARAVKRPNEECNFTLLLAEDELFVGQNDAQVEIYLTQAQQCLLAMESESPTAQTKTWQELQARFWMLTGQLQYRVKYEDAYKAASVSLKQALNIALSLSNKALAVRCALHLGLVERRLENWSGAKEVFRRALSIAQAQSDTSLEFECIRSLGMVARKCDEFLEARGHYETALKLAEKMEGALAKEMALSGLGRLEDELGRYDVAKPLLDEALVIARGTHNTRGMRIELTRLINVLIPLREIDRATELMKESELLNRQADDYIGLAWNLKHQGQLEQLAGNVAHGNGLIQQGIDMLKKYHIREHIDEFSAAIRQTP
ncbi:hypothetical protein GPROT1_02945 [Gammaproteobacteria bacterium]|nr:hypothetical protein GPROT1_02945 [Gammaproteobacteria bacterium]